MSEKSKIPVRVRGARRGYRAGGTPWRLLPWLALAAAIHFVILVLPPRASHALAGNGAEAAKRAVARKLIELVARASAQPESEPPLQPQEERVQADEAPAEQPSEQPPEPEHSLRKELEGAEQTPPEESRDEPEPQPEPQPEIVPPADETSASAEEVQEADAGELRRAEWRRIFAEPERADGHFYAALQRWGDQARRKLDDRPERAEGVEDGLPQLRRHPTESDAEFYSALDLFGGEVFGRTDEGGYWHLERSGRSFAARPLGSRGLKKIARERGLNLGFVIPLDRDLGQLPAALLAARPQALVGAMAAGLGPGDVSRFFILGTTREQSAVADAAQTYLRRHRQRFPNYPFWSSAQEISYRYLLDAHQTVYGIEIVGVR